MKNAQHGTIGKFTVWTVDGEVVRNRIYQDFVAGGNEARYPWVPRGELWIEKTMTPTDAVGVIVHEFVETEAMLRGASYSDGHERANRIERDVRRSQARGHVAKPRNIEEAVIVARTAIGRE